MTTSIKDQTNGYTTTVRERPQADVLADEVAALSLDPPLAQAITTYLQAAQQIIDDQHHVHESRLKVRGGGKRLAIDCEDFSRTTGERCSGRIFCFIVIYPTNTKALGQTKVGDILKPASYKTPAKHARGNVLDAHNGLMGSDGNTPLQWTGPHYVK